MLDNLDDVLNRFKEIETQLSDPQIVSDMKQFAKLNKEYKDLGKICPSIIAYQNIVGNIQSAKDMLFKEKDQELKDMAKAEIETLTAQEQHMEEALKLLLIPKEPLKMRKTVWLKYVPVQVVMKLLCLPVTFFVCM